MKINMYEGGGNLDGNIDIPGGSLTGPLLLSGTVNSGAEAVHKQYIDTEAANVNANGITTGTISGSRMPAFTGDAVSNLGNTILTLNNTGVVNGDYSKVTVNAKGLVTSGGSLVENDIPNFDWSKITSGKPTTLLGYGITDALNSTNGIVTGQLTLNSDPVDNNDLATKQYVDSNLSGGSGLVVGDIINTSINVTPEGFLRCNGGQVSKTEYSALYSVVGDAYSISGTPGSGQPWRQQYLFNTTQSTDITGWTTGTALPGTVGNSQAIVTKNRVYLLGGYNGSYLSTVYTAPINEDGTLGTWTTGTALPGTLGQSQAIVTKSRVYLLGGFNGSNYLSTVYTAPINEDGTLGTWTTGTSLPGTVSSSQVIVTKSRVYLLSGLINGSWSSTVYTAPINEDGTLGTWTTGTALPGTVGHSQAIVTKSRVYLLGGYNGSSWSSTVYTAPINEDGTLGTWMTGTSLPGTLGHSQAIVTKSRVYLLGGIINDGWSSTVYTAPINEDGTLGTWTTGTSLPGTVGQSQAIVTKSRVYLLGGYINSNWSSTVYIAPFSGGLNNYMDLVAITPTDLNNFRLPDYTLAETSSLYFYIKT